MTTEIAVLVSILALVSGAYFGAATKRHAERKDAQQESAAMTTVMVKLEAIGSGVNEIKADIRNVREDVNATRERLIVVEQSAKQAHKRLDDITSRRKPATEE